MRHKICVVWREVVFILSWETGIVLFKVEHKMGFSRLWSTKREE